MNNQDSMAGSVIQASGMVTFEDVLMTDAAAADTWLACSVRTNPVVNLVAHACSHLTQGGCPHLGSLVRKAICQIEMDQMSSASCGQHLKSYLTLGCCGVRFNWPRKLGTIE